MTYEEALLAVRPHVQKFQQYSVVSHEDAQRLLGDRFKNLLSDTIRSTGPAAGWFYYWNVATYMSMGG